MKTFSRLLSLSLLCTRTWRCASTCIDVNNAQDAQSIPFLEVAGTECFTGN